MRQSRSKGKSKSNKDQERNFVRQRVMETLAHHLFGTIMPFIIGILLLLLFGQGTRIIELVDKGDLFLYTAAISTTTILLFRRYKSDDVPIDSTIQALAGVFLFIAGVLYAGIYVERVFIQSIYSSSLLNIPFVRIGSMSLFVLTVVMCTRAIYLQEKLMPPKKDVIKESRKDISKIKKALI